MEAYQSRRSGATGAEIQPLLPLEAILPPQEEASATVGLVARKRKKNPGAPILTLLLGAAAIGGGIYWWNKREDEKAKGAKEKKVEKDAGCFTGFWAPATPLNSAAQDIIGGPIDDLYAGVDTSRMPPQLQYVLDAMNANKVFIQKSKQVQVANTVAAHVAAATIEEYGVPTFPQEVGIDSDSYLVRQFAPSCLGFDMDYSSKDVLSIQDHDHPSYRAATKEELEFVLSVSSMESVATLAKFGPPDPNYGIYGTVMARNEAYGIEYAIFRHLDNTSFFWWYQSDQGPVPGGTNLPTLQAAEVDVLSGLSAVVA